ncbi:hypothetical protein [Streptomyces albipurpureus]|uniref:Uncharacterized protein n=1 Tax=Streptomyces albipurpureus TaxID=2897419 RepID=A0ABT0UMX5_9ACTN|nr:hypothetical protein [Streptomyces sp. CWNU-1]MCM2389805.1 hypothetical protein [Streptomyces sp. CWNU-1]
MESTPLTAIEARRVWPSLLAARASYRAAVSPAYDEVLWEVAQRAEDTGSLGKVDIGALMVWKRLSARTAWVAELMGLPDVQIRSITARAMEAVREMAEPRGEAARKGRSIVWELPGCRTGDALASTLLTAAAPHRMAVYDRRAHHALTSLGLTLTDDSGRYSRYMNLLDGLLTHADPLAADWTAREIDIALYWIGTSTPMR